MRKREKRSAGVFQRVIWLFLLVVALDIALLTGMLYGGGVFQRIHENALGILAETTYNRYLGLQNRMNGWANLDTLGEKLNASVEDTLAQSGGTYAEFLTDAALCASVVNSCVPSLMEHVVGTNVSGVFLVLNGEGIPGDASSYAGVYIRDAEPDTYIATNSDLSLLRGLPPLSRGYGVTLDREWQACFRFEGGQDNPDNDFFYKPLAAYAKTQKGLARYYGYWSGRFAMGDSIPIFTYSRPLISKGGRAYGVVGVELNIDYVAEIISNGDHSERGRQSCFLLGIENANGPVFRNVLSSGMLYRQHFAQNDDLTAQGAYESGGERFINAISGKTGLAFTGAVHKLALYSANTAFISQQWVLIGFQESATLFQMETALRNIIAIVICLGLVMGVIIALIAARSITHPITRMIDQIRQINHKSVKPLLHSGVSEIDILADTISEINRTVVEDASKISQIITLSGLPIGVFEEKTQLAEVFCSNGFFRLLNCEQLNSGDGYVPMDAFQKIMADRLGDEADIEGDIYLVKGESPKRYLRLRSMQRERDVIGTLLDVTEDIEKRRRIEHDRDYDMLTDLLNRRAFAEQVQKLFADKPEVLQPYSALLMLDLDNLKSINDMYGHDIGDLYIRTLADGMRALGDERSVIARRSGDEFFIFYYGYGSKREIRNVIDKGWGRMMEQTCEMPDGSGVRVRASGGISWYPDDAETLDQLVHYADFAMYRAKNKLKGSVEDFSQADYSEAGYMFNGSQALNRLFEERLVRYMYQPIISARDGGVLGYEMLMRPMVSELSSPVAVLNLAREQGKMYRVEQLTWHEALYEAWERRTKGDIASDAKLFINSIANQILTDDDEQKLVAAYQSMFSSVVLEVTEEERNNDSFMLRKSKWIASLGGEVAIDDFGSGYNSETTLITIDASYVKLDITLVRNVHKEPDKRMLIASIIQFAKKRGIAVIAEGVETLDELRAVIALQVDYLQGYYIARPAFDPPNPNEEALQAIREAGRSG